LTSYAAYLLQRYDRVTKIETAAIVIHKLTGPFVGNDAAIGELNFSWSLGKGRRCVWDLGFGVQLRENGLKVTTSRRYQKYQS
jgi:hypothetical protein